MAHKKKRQDKLIAGFLALITAFSPVASVVPVYAADLNNNDTSSSVTMDPDSIQIDETGSGGIVLDDTDEGSDGITVIGDDNNGESGDGISIGDSQENGDGIQIDGTGSDGIDIGETTPNDADGIQVDGTQSDGIDIDKVTSSDGIDIEETTPNIGDGIDIEYDDDGSIILDSLNPWDGISESDVDNTLGLEDGDVSDFSVPRELDIDIRSVHSVVKISPVDSDELSQQRIVRVSYSDQDETYVTTVTDGNGKQIYQAAVSDIGDIAWAEFVDGDYII